MSTPSMPFKILALAPFTNNPAGFSDASPVDVDRDNLSEIIGNFNIEVFIPLPRDLCPAGEIQLSFSRVKDFHPDGMIQSNPYLAELARAKKFLETAAAEGLSDSEIRQGLDRFPAIPAMRVETPAKKPKKETASSIDNLLSMVAIPGDETGPAPSLSKPSDRIDAIISQVLEQIYSHPDFIKLDEAWRGVGFLMDQGAVGENVRLSIAPIDPENPEETLESLPPELVDDLPSVILADLAFDNTARSMENIEALARLGEMLMVPAMAGIGPKFFYLDSWRDFKKISYLTNYIDDSKYARWRTFKASPTARWLTMSCNRFLCRYPYGEDNPPRTVKFHETGQPWTNPVWGIGALLGQSVEMHGWPTHFTDFRHIRLQDLALDNRDPQNPLPTEISLSTDRVEQLSRIGIMPLVGQKKSDTAFAPMETTVGNESLAYQLTLSFTTQCIIWCQDHLPKSLDPRELKANLEKKFSDFFERNGRGGLENLDIATEGPDSENRIPVHIRIKTARNVLASGRGIELDLLW